jgi:hypothetical protein
LSKLRDSKPKVINALLVSAAVIGVASGWEFGLRAITLDAKSAICCPECCPRPFCGSIDRSPDEERIDYTSSEGMAAPGVRASRAPCIALVSRRLSSILDATLFMMSAFFGRGRSKALFFTRCGIVSCGRAAKVGWFSTGCLAYATC